MSVKLWNKGICLITNVLPVVWLSRPIFSTQYKAIIHQTEAETIGFQEDKVRIGPQIWNRKPQKWGLAHRLKPHLSISKMGLIIFKGPSMVLTFNQITIHTLMLPGGCYQVLFLLLPFLRTNLSHLLGHYEGLFRQSLYLQMLSHCHLNWYLAVEALYKWHYK